MKSRKSINYAVEKNKSDNVN